MAIKHDRLFKELLRTFFFEFLELFFPEVATYVDPGSVEFLDKEVFTDVTSGKRHVADLVARVRFRGEPASFLIHTEAQGRKQSHFASRMFAYFARFHELHGLPVYPIAVFSYLHGKEEPRVYEVTFPDIEVLRFNYRTVQLNRLNWRDFVRSSNPVASALMARMRIKKTDRPRVKVECLRLLATLGLNRAKQQLISGFVDSYLRLNEEELVVFKQEITTLEPKEAEAVFKMTTSWKEEGILEGKRDGILEGKADGLRQSTFKILSRRFGAVPDDLTQALEAIKDPVRLEEILDSAFDNSLDSIRALLSANGV